MHRNSEKISVAGEDESILAVGKKGGRRTCESGGIPGDAVMVWQDQEHQVE